MKIPKSWKDITIANYQAARQVLTTSYDNPVEQNIDLLQALTGEERWKILRISQDEFFKALKQLQFLQKLPSAKPVRYFIIGSTVYKTPLQIEKVTGGQYIDLMTFSKNPEGVIDNLHKILAVLCPKYSFKNFERRADHLQRYCSMQTAYSIAVFFCQVWENLTPQLSEFLKATAKEIEVST